MSTAASMSPTMPTSKKRCWTLLVKDIKNLNVKEAEVMSAFRKRYTSARHLAFRSPANYGGGNFHAASDNRSTTFESVIGEGTVLIEVHFTGPQPIEGPAGLLCTLLKSTFVAAYPIPLGRGRKRKVRSGVAGASFSLAPASSSSSGGGGKADRVTTGTSTASTSTCNRSTRAFASTTNFNRNSGNSVYPATRAPVPKAARHNNAITRINATDTGGEVSTAGVFSSTGSATSSVGNVDDLFGYLPGGGSAALAATSTLPETRLLQNNPNRRQPNASTAAGTRPGLDLCSSSDLGRAAGNRRENATPQDAGRSLWAAGGNSTAGAAATAASENGLWDILLDDRDTSPCRAPQSCPGKQPPWAVGFYPVRAPTKVEINDKSSENASGSAGDLRAFSASTTAMEQQQRWGRSWSAGYGDGRCTTPDAVGGLKLPTAGHQISFNWREEECGFDGCSTTSPSADAGEVSPTASPHGTTPVGSLCHFQFQGLQSAVQGHELHDLVATALFFIDAEKSNTVEKTASPLAVDASGHAHATVTYPSMLEIWPEMYIMNSIRVVEVAMVVEVRSRDGSFVYTGPTLKVIYRRSTMQIFTSTVSMTRQVPEVPCALRPGLLGT